jgi:hypothetical protein
MTASFPVRTMLHEYCAISFHINTSGYMLLLYRKLEITSLHFIRTIPQVPLQKGTRRMSEMHLSTPKHTRIRCKVNFTAVVNRRLTDIASAELANPALMLPNLHKICLPIRTGANHLRYLMRYILLHTFREFFFLLYLYIV